MIKCEWLGLTKTLRWHLILVEVLIKCLTLAIKGPHDISLLISLFFLLYHLTFSFIQYALATLVFSLCFEMLITFWLWLGHWLFSLAWMLSPKLPDFLTASFFSSLRFYLKFHFHRVLPWFLYLDQPR